LWIAGVTKAQSTNIKGFLLSSFVFEIIDIYDSVIRYIICLIVVLVDNPLAIIQKNGKTKLTAEKAEVIVRDKKYITPLKIKPENLFDNIGFGSIIDYEVKDNQLIVTVDGQISPASFFGYIIIVYEYRDKMFQAKSIEFQPCK
jgi:hypothetical protein